MEIRPAHRPRSWPLLAAAAASLTVAAPAFAGTGPGPAMREARAAARAVVVDHQSYRSIRSSHPLVHTFVLALTPRGALLALPLGADPVRARRR